MDGIRDKVLVLTGANGGIARAIAEEFFHGGASLLLTDVNDEPKSGSWSFAGSPKML